MYFRLESETTCVDIDECEEGEEGICEQGCVNKPGTYTCMKSNIIMQFFPPMSSY